jgi:hypothetical protein
MCEILFSITGMHLCTFNRGGVLLVDVIDSICSHDGRSRADQRAGMNVLGRRKAKHLLSLQVAYRRFYNVRFGCPTAPVLEVLKIMMPARSIH